MAMLLASKLNGAAAVKGQKEPVPQKKASVVKKELPTSEEFAAVARIREANRDDIARLKYPDDDVVGDLRLTRFLRARNGNEAEASEWFAEFLKMRLDTCPEIESKIRPAVIGMTGKEFAEWCEEREHPAFLYHPYAGPGKNEAIVAIGRWGLLDAVQFTESRGDISLSQDKLVFFATMEWTHWFLNQESRRRGEMAYVLQIADVSGLGGGGRKLPMFVPKWKEFFGVMMRALQKNYCESSSEVLLVNTPLAFRAVFSAVSVWLTPRQKAKIRVLGDTKDPNVRAQLLETAPASVLPMELGGQRPGLPLVYPPQGAGAIPTWVQRWRGRDLWPRYEPTEDPASRCATPGSSSTEDPASRCATPESSSTEASSTDELIISI